MSLYPLKITENPHDSKIDNLKSSVENGFENLLQTFQISSKDLKILKSLTFTLISELSTAYNKEKLKSFILLQQFDQIQQEAVKEFNLRQNDYLKQIDLFENELKKLRNENRSLINQIESLKYSSKKLRKSSNPIFKNMIKDRNKPDLVQLEKNIFALQGLLEIFTQFDENKDSFSEVSDILPQIDSFEDSFMNKSVKVVTKGSNKTYFRASDTEIEVFRVQNPVNHFIIDKRTFFANQTHKEIDFGKDSVSSLSCFLEDTYKKSVKDKKSVLKENFRELASDKTNVKNESVYQKLETENKENLETFRTGTERQINVSDSFRTIYESAEENTVSTIFPELEDSPH